MRQCTHPRRGIVTTHPDSMPAIGDVHAARTTCDRVECIEAAIFWCQGETGLPAAFKRDSSHPSGSDGDHTALTQGGVS